MIIMIAAILIGLLLYQPITGIIVAILLGCFSIARAALFAVDPIMSAICKWLDYVDGK